MCIFYSWCANVIPNGSGGVTAITPKKPSAWKGHRKPNSIWNSQRNDEMMRWLIYLSLWHVMNSSTSMAWSMNMNTNSPWFTKNAWLWTMRDNFFLCFPVYDSSWIVRFPLFDSSWIVRFRTRILGFDFSCDQRQYCEHSMADFIVLVLPSHRDPLFRIY